MNARARAAHRRTVLAVRRDGADSRRDEIAARTFVVAAAVPCGRRLDRRCTRSPRWRGDPRPHPARFQPCQLARHPGPRRRHQLRLRLQGRAWPSVHPLARRPECDGLRQTRPRQRRQGSGDRHRQGARGQQAGRAIPRRHDRAGHASPPVPPDVARSCELRGERCRDLPGRARLWPRRCRDCLVARARQAQRAAIAGTARETCRSRCMSSSRWTAPETASNLPARRARQLANGSA